jgi:DNA polymerase-3 subunit delta'
MDISSRDRVILEKLRQGFRSGRLAHAFLIASAEMAYGRAFLTPLTQAILETDHLPHPDHFILRPSGLMAQIKTEEARSLCQRVQQTPLVGRHKVVWIEGAERCPPSAANVLLKTLEEPSAGSFFFLLSAHPSSLLPTVQSRCCFLRLRGTMAPPSHPPWEDWKRRWREWLLPLFPHQEQRPKLLPIPPLYALLATLESRIARMLEGAKESDPGSTESPDEEAAPADESAKRTLQQRLWADLENSVEALWREQGDVTLFKLLPPIIATLGKCRGLSELNLSFSTALEAWLIFTAQALLNTGADTCEALENGGEEDVFLPSFS